MPDLTEWVFIALAVIIALLWHIGRTLDRIATQLYDKDR